MAKMGKFDIRGLKEFQKQLQKLQKPDEFVEAFAKELAQRLYRELIQNTPYITHTLQRGWSIAEIKKEGNTYIIEIVNPVEYASYVNYGHRTIKIDGYGWCPGILFVEQAVQNIENISKPLLEKRMNEYLGKIMKG